MSEVKIMIATHRDYDFPNDKTYAPVHVGRVNGNSFGCVGDDTGENISHKNPNYCELSGLYWAWKNKFFSQAKYCGLVHYRRHFSGSLQYKGNFSILSGDDVIELMKDCDILLPKKRKYYVETVKNHYANAHSGKDMDSLQKVVSELYPEYLPTFDYVLSQRGLYLYNMFVMSPDKFDKYCTWLFHILFVLEERVDITNYDNYQKRIFGFLSERLFNVWILHNKFRIKEVKIISVEGENLYIKAFNLLKRKYLSN